MSWLRGKKTGKIPFNVSQMMEKIPVQSRVQGRGLNQQEGACVRRQTGNRRIQRDINMLLTVMNPHLEQLRLSWVIAPHTFFFVSHICNYKLFHLTCVRGACPRFKNTLTSYSFLMLCFLLSPCEKCSAGNRKHSHIYNRWMLGESRLR